MAALVPRGRLTFLPTTGKTSLPAANSSGLPGTPQATVPTLTAGQYLMQFDGIYNPATTQVTWSIPYQSSAKFGSLSAVATNTGALTVTGPVSSANGKFQVNADGGATMSALTVLSAVDGSVILRSDASLAQQTFSNPNLCPTPQGFSNFYNCGPNRNGDPNFRDGQYIWMPTRTDTNYVGAESPALGIPPGAIYTVSFFAYCTGASRQLICDVVTPGFNYDSNGISIAVDNVHRQYSYTETMANVANATQAFLRLFTGTPYASEIVLSNIKVELGNKVTPWCDSVVTAANASTFIASAAIKLAMIDRASIGSLSAITATIGSLKSSEGFPRQQLSDYGGITFAPNGVKVFQFGNLDWGG
jgi:hypothetical protein